MSDCGHLHLDRSGPGNGCRVLRPLPDRRPRARLEPPMSETRGSIVNERGALEPVVVLTHNNRKPVLPHHHSVRPKRHRDAQPPFRVMSERGNIVWRNAGRLVPGDVIVSALFGAEEATCVPVLAGQGRFLGYLVAEGTLGEANRHAVRFTNWDAEVAAGGTGSRRLCLGSASSTTRTGSMSSTTSPCVDASRTVWARLRQCARQGDPAPGSHGRRQGPGRLLVCPVRRRWLDRPHLHDRSGHCLRGARPAGPTDVVRVGDSGVYPNHPQRPRVLQRAHQPGRCSPLPRHRRLPTGVVRIKWPRTFVALRVIRSSRTFPTYRA